MKTALYPARIHLNKKDKVFYVQFLDLKNGFTFGETLEQAKEMAADVLSALLASYIEHNEKIPEPRKHKGKIFTGSPPMPRCRPLSYCGGQGRRAHREK